MMEEESSGKIFSLWVIMGRNHSFKDIDLLYCIHLNIIHRTCLFDFVFQYVYIKGV